jgi:nucleoid-associated protein YgaU
VIYEANRDQIKDPNRIYPGQAIALPTTGSNAAR